MPEFFNPEESVAAASLSIVLRILVLLAMQVSIDSLMLAKYALSHSWRLDRSRLGALLLVAASPCTACGTGADTGGSATPPTKVSVQSTAATQHAKADGNDAAVIRLITEHLAAVGRGDLSTYLSALSPDVRYDIAGAIYDGLDAVRGWAERDPFGQHGRYDDVTVTVTPQGAVADATFRAGSLTEAVRYTYTVTSGRISVMVARYRT